MSAPHSNPAPGIWIDPVTGQAYDAATMEPVTTAGANLGEKPRDPRGYHPPLTEDDLEEFARQLAGRAKLDKNPEPGVDGADGAA